MNLLQNWGFPLITSLLLHTAIMLLPVQYGGQKENNVRKMTFRLASLPQKTQASSVKQAVYQPKRKPSPPKMAHTQQQPRKPVPPKTARIRIQKKTKAVTDETVDPVSAPLTADLADATQSLSGNPAPGNMPTDPVVLSTELSVICPELTAPAYPKPSRQLGEYGDVVLRLEVSEAGVVKSAQVVNSSGYKRLDEAAIDATKSWRCNPPHQNGQPVSAIALQPFNFVLQ
jgi:protein TonB